MIDGRVGAVVPLLLSCAWTGQGRRTAMAAINCTAHTTNPAVQIGD